MTDKPQSAAVLTYGVGNSTGCGQEQRATSRQNRAITQLVLAIFTVSSLVGIFAVPLLTASTLAGDPNPLSQPWTLCIGAVMTALALLFHRSAVRLFERVVEIARRLPRTSYVLLILAVGLVIRVIWMMAVPAPEVSDSAVYLHLARDLVGGGPYEIAGTRSYWPPGYPLFLALLMKLLGDGFWIPKVGNLLLYVALVPPAYLLARRCADEGAARVAVLLIAVWPGFFSAAAFGNKDLLLATLLVVGAWSYTVPATGLRRAALWAVLAGVSLGFAALTQPSTLLLPTTLALYDLLYGAGARRCAVRLACLIAAMALTIGPWTVRNFEVHNQFVLISTNGGDNFYYGNNPAATGSLIKGGVEELRGLDEITASKYGARLARDWILSHPLEFAALAVKKQIYLLGDDSSAIYFAIKRGLGIDDFRYVLLKGGTNLFWIAFLVALLAVCLARWRTRPVELTPAQYLVAAFCLYPYLLHSVVMAISRYHLAFIPFMAIAIAMLASDARQRSAT